MQFPQSKTGLEFIKMTSSNIDQDIRPQCMSFSILHRRQIPWSNKNRHGNTAGCAAASDPANWLQSWHTVLSVWLVSGRSCCENVSSLQHTTIWSVSELALVNYLWEKFSREPNFSKGKIQCIFQVSIRNGKQKSPDHMLLGVFITIFNASLSAQI